RGVHAVRRAHRRPPAARGRPRAAPVGRLVHRTGRGGAGAGMSLSAPDVGLLGCDFTSAPTRRKPIVLAVGRSDRGRVVLQGIEHLQSLDAWTERLRSPGPWVGGFDLPFGLPRELVQALGWPLDWRACIAHYAGLPRSAVREAFAAF